MKKDKLVSTRDLESIGNEHCLWSDHLQTGLKAIIYVVAVGLSLFHLYTAAFGSIYSVFQRSIHLAAVMAIIFFIHPSSKRQSNFSTKILDLLCICLSVFVNLYLIVDFEGITERSGIPILRDLIIGGVAIILVLEACRRVVGISVSLVASIFLLYAIFGHFIPGFVGHRELSLSTIIENLYLTTEGIYSVILGISATFVAVFIVFGAFISIGGMGDFIMDVAMSVAGGAAGGPAKVSVVSSGMMAIMSGSSTANIVTTGSFTIPMMKKLGYKKEFAGAVETVASVGGMITPPVMGAAAFIIAEFIGVPYVTIAKAAAIPALLYYIAIFTQVHLRAKKTGLRGLPKSELPKLWPVLRRKGHLVIPIIILCVFLLLDYSPSRVGFFALVTLVILGIIEKIVTKGGAGFSFRSIIVALEKGARTMITVAIACAAAGIIIGVVNMTGLGLKFVTLIEAYSYGILPLTLLMTGTVCLLLGMGVPPTASYVILATMAAPAMVKLGVIPIAAHLFILYWAVLADVTPPVCIGAYVAAGIAGGHPMLTGFAACRLAAAGFLVPFTYCFEPALLGIGPINDVILALTTAIIGVCFLAIGIERHLICSCNIYETILSYIAALCLIKPGILTDIAGILIIFIIIASQVLRYKRKKKKQVDTPPSPYIPVSEQM